MASINTAWVLVVEDLYQAELWPKCAPKLVSTP
jgi:hypothetical protein